MSDDSSEVLWQRSPFVAFVVGQERVVLLDLTHTQSAKPRLLAGSAAAVWRALERPATAAELTVKVGSTFETPPAEIRFDVERFLNSMHQARLVAAVS